MGIFSRVEMQVGFQGSLAPFDLIVIEKAFHNSQMSFPG
jgi:hypothetical protein